MKAMFKIFSIFTVLAVAFYGFGCCSVKSPASKGHMPTNSVAKVAPVKAQKNDPDHLYRIYPNGEVESQVWTNASQ